MKSSLLRFLLIALVLAGSVAHAQDQKPEPVTKSKVMVRPVDPAMVEIEDVAGLPRILLIGDSISMGYTLPVRAKLKGMANVHRPLENCGDSTRGVSRLDKWLGTGKWDVIHFNFGLHDLKYLDEKGQYVPPDKGNQVAGPEVYRSRLRELTVKLKATGAKLIFATTTPVPVGTTGRVAGDEAIYNKVALEVMKELAVSVDDLCAFVIEQQKTLPPRQLSEQPKPPKRATLRPGEIQLPYNVHFSPGGYEKLAEQVVASIKPLLPSKP